MNVTITSIDPIHVAYVREVGPYHESAERAWRKLMAWAGPKGVISPEKRCLGVSHDDPAVTPAEKLRYDACIEVDDSVSAEGDIHVQDIPGGDYAVYRHVGPYAGLQSVYEGLYGGWLPASGREARRQPPFEMYVNDPGSTPENELVTDIYLPLVDPDAAPA